MIQSAEKKGGYLFGDDYVDASFDAAPKQIDEAAIRKQANMVNGGEAALAACPKCGGSGQTRWGPCFKCHGRGKVGIRVAAAAKGKRTKLENEAKWRDAHAAEIAYMRKRSDKGSGFYSSLLDKLTSYGTLTDGQLGVIQRDIAKDAEFWAKKKAERTGTIGVDKIDALFETAKANGLARPIFRTERLTIKRAPATGRNPGALYVTDRDLGGEYVGMIKDGQFKAQYRAKPDTLKLLCEIAENPLEAAVKYGRATGNCCICDRELTDPVSVANGIGPICQERFGF